ncbi:MAG TPA: hypothetical protein VMC83_20435 [Streptosporangiaceae bacterium]|nr:hypothetical protein [Streptosporangiaceae bacterium]
MDRPGDQERHDLTGQTLQDDRDAEAPADGGDAARRRPWWVWTVPFAAVMGVLLVRNAFLFSTPLHEDADMGANSILIEQARRFTLLVGHYSREKFNHPGPAFLYVQSWGESIFWAGLHVVPAAWNGQLIAVYALNALFAALVVAVGYGVTRSVRGAAACCAAVLAFAALIPATFSSDWMPYILVMPFLAFTVAIASVAAGNLRDAWIAALAGWFLINGNVAFLFFVPVIAAGCVVALGWPRRRSLRASARSFFATQRRVWIPVLVISALFAFPIVLNTALHWPGEFGKYLSYSKHGDNHLRQVVHYTLHFWWPGAARVGWLVPVAAYVVAGLLTWRLAPGPARRFCVSLLAFDTLTSIVFLVYAKVAIDELDPAGYFIGYFYWSAPAIMLLVALFALTESLPSAVGLTVAAIAAMVACTAFAIAPQTQTSTNHTDPANTKSGPDTDPSLPDGVAAMAALADGRPIVLRLQHNAWPSMTGLLVQAERTGVIACVADPGWEFMVTSQFICTPAELADGAKFGLYLPGQAPRGAPVVFRLRRSIVTPAPSGT